MDGSLALIFLITSLTDMGLNDCKTGRCLQEYDASARISLQGGQVLFQEEQQSEEVYFGYDLPRQFGPFQPTIGASLTDENGLWVGAGFKWTSQDMIAGPLFLETSLMPGLYSRGNGPDLGGSLHFRSALGLGYRFDNGGTLALLYDHRSNGDTQNLNPGLETIAIRYAFVIE
ncbi:acyloxyacyl hydrolase [Yoonia maritima]|uniref:acyloxyacyl hydrolase n=1 Tax=Yoonia maritima TaxID=1435347 RepID=UPI000D0FB059|nr:acyloxyacyl hydrolase [Yoonia maritima]